MSINSSETLRAIHQLREEINKLRKQESEAMERAAFAAVTPDEARACDERRKTIAKLVQEMAMLRLRPGRDIWHAR